MRIHILGICGTFMGSLAVLAKEAGFEVIGCDEAVYPPMSTQLEAQGIQLIEGYHPSQFDSAPDVVIIGNALSRGNPAVEYVLKKRLAYTSGPAWLAEQVLSKRWVIAVSGTHGKTTTTALIAWILEHAGLHPGFLIGGVPVNFSASARLGTGPFFIVEADEYDSAFFDKRSKFIHYHPRTLIINNIEFDHADIFDNLAAIKTQFHHLVRTIPGDGLIIFPSDDSNVSETIQRGCWTPTETFAGQEGVWRAEDIATDGRAFNVYRKSAKVGRVQWELLGQHNVRNALAALAAAHHAGIHPETAIAALQAFKGVKRRLELLAQIHGVSVYDDFAHHPTAIKTTLAGLRAKVGGNVQIIAITEFGSNTMRAGCHREELPHVFGDANYVVMLRPENAQWDIDELAHELPIPASVQDHVHAIVDEVIAQVRMGDHIVVMSNKGFGGIHQKLLNALQSMVISA